MFVAEIRKMATEGVNIDKILDTIYARNEKNRKSMKMPAPIPEAILRKYRGNLPKPPPPKLPKRFRHPKEEIDDEEASKVPYPKPCRDWFPNKENQEEEEQQDMATMDEQQEYETQWEMEGGRMGEMQWTMDDQGEEGYEKRDEQEDMARGKRHGRRNGQRQTRKTNGTRKIQ